MKQSEILDQINSRVDTIGAIVTFISFVSAAQLIYLLSLLK